MNIMRFCNYAIMGMWNYENVLRGQSHNPIISQSHNSTISQCHTRIVAKLEEILPLCERLKSPSGGPAGGEGVKR